MKKFFIGICALAIITFYPIEEVLGAFPEGWHGWSVVMHEVIGPDNSCGPGSILIDLEIRDYDTDLPVNGLSTQFWTYRTSDFSPVDSTTESDSLVGPLCFNPHTQGIGFDVDGGPGYYNFWTQRRISDPAQIPAVGHHIRSVVWVVATPRAPLYQPVSPMNVITNTNPSYVFRLNQFPGRFGATGLSRAGFFLYNINNLNQIVGIANARTVSLSGTGTQTIPPVSGLADGRYAWGAFLDLNGSRTHTNSSPNFESIGISQTGLMLAFWPFVLDATAPVIDVTSAHSPSAPDSSDSIDITGAATDNLSGIVQMQIFVNNNLTETCTYSARASATCDTDVGPFPAGTTVSYFVTARDQAGNVATSTTNSFTVTGSAAPLPLPPTVTPPPTGTPLVCTTPTPTVTETAQAVGPTGIAETQTLKRVGNLLYVGASAGGSNDDLGMYIFDISDPANITQLSFFSTHNPATVRNNTWGNQVVDVDVVGNYAYLTTLMGGLVIVDISNPNTPVFEGRIPLFNLNPPGATETWDVEVVGNYAYLAAGRGMIVVDVSNKSAPVVASNLDLGTPIAQEIIISGNRAFVAMRQNGLAVVDISNPTNPVLLSRHTARYFGPWATGSSWAYDMVLYGSYLYVADNLRGRISIYEVDSGGNLAFVNDFPTTGSHVPRNLYIDNGVLYVGSSFEGAYVFDLANPANPTLLYRVDNPTLATSAYVWDVVPLNSGSFEDIIVLALDWIARINIYVVSVDCNPAPNPPQLLVCPATIPSLPTGSTTTLTAHYWASTTSPFTCASDLTSGTNVSASATWTTGNTSVASVNSTGLVTGVDPGSTLITATHLGLNDATNVTVVGTPDLLPDGLPVLENGDLEQGQNVEFSALARNNGNADSGNFRANFSFSWGSPTGWTDLPVINKTNIEAGEESDDEDILNLPLGNSGTLYIQYCVDSDLAVAESNEANNCVFRSFNVDPLPIVLQPPTNLASTTVLCGGLLGVSWDAVVGADRYEVSLNGGSWTSVPPSANPTHTFSGLTINTNHTVRVRVVVGANTSLPAELVVRSSGMCTVLNGSACIIAAGAGTCNTATVTWDMTGGQSPYAVRNITDGNALISDSVSGTRSDVTLVYGANTIRMFSDGTGVEYITLTASCVPGFVHVSSLGYCAPEPTIILEPNPTIWVRSDGVATVEVSVVAPYDLECTIPGNIVDGASTFTHDGSLPTPSVHTITTQPITFSRIFRVNCRTSSGDVNTTRSTRINMIPRMQEG